MILVEGDLFERISPGYGLLRPRNDPAQSNAAPIRLGRVAPFYEEPTRHEAITPVSSSRLVRTTKARPTNVASLPPQNWE
jgi:hypothetical protein